MRFLSYVKFGDAKSAGAVNKFAFVLSINQETLLYKSFLEKAAI